jgi:hypothetical protein
MEAVMRVIKNVDVDVDISVDDFIESLSEDDKRNTLDQLLDASDPYNLYEIAATKTAEEILEALRKYLEKTTGRLLIYPHEKLRESA